MKDYRVDLDVYNGPLDLLLYLIRKEEVDIYDIPIARITAQYVAYVQLIEEIDPNVAGDFLVLAATLLEIKSRTLLPRPPAEEAEEEVIDPRLELVRQLLEYKRFKDAARRLGVAADVQGLKYPPAATPLEGVLGEIELDEAQIWDLLDAFHRLLEATGRPPQLHEVIYDDTPLALHATDILDLLVRAGGSQRFESIFEGRTRGQLIGLFLALLELIRRRRVRVEQDAVFGPIVIHVLDASPIEEGFHRAFEPQPVEPETEPTGDGAMDFGECELDEPDLWTADAEESGSALTELPQCDPSKGAVESTQRQPDDGLSRAGGFSAPGAAGETHRPPRDMAPTESGTLETDP